MTSIIGIVFNGTGEEITSKFKHRLIQFARF